MLHPWPQLHPPPSMFPTWQPVWCSSHIGQIKTQFRLPSSGNCSLRFLHPGHRCHCDLLFVTGSLQLCSFPAVSSCLPFSPSNLIFFGWKGFFSGYLFNSFKTRSHLHQTITPCPPVSSTHLLTCFQYISLPWYVFFFYNTGTLFPSFIFLLFPPLQHNPHDFRKLVFLPLHL